MEVKAALYHYTLRLGDNSLILGHRISEWCGHGPILEQDIALINVSLDLIGQARSLLSYAGEIEGKGKTEDHLAYFRTERNFYNALITELPNENFGFTIVRQFICDAYNNALYTELQHSKDAQLAAIAAKSLKESTYHLRHSSEWLIRLGDGTDESKQIVQESLDDIWMYTEDLFATTAGDLLLMEKSIVPDTNKIKQAWSKTMDEVLTQATLTRPQEQWMQSGSRDGIHTEYMGYILAEMQYLPRMHPEATW